MKKFLMIGISVSLWMLLTMHSAAEPLQVVTLEYPPLEYEEQGAIKGIAVDIVKEVFARMQQPITIKLYPFARALEMIKEGKADAIFTFSKLPERETFADYPSEVLVEQTVSLFVRQDAPITYDGDVISLRPYTCGVMQGAKYGPIYDEAMKTMKVEEVTDHWENVLKLAKNRLDVIIGPRLVILFTIKALGHQGDVKELYPPLETVPTYLAFSKTRVAPGIKEQFERILKELKRDGTYDNIIQSYIK
jgi:polar amino acid transport system substrate-binding protein